MTSTRPRTPPTGTRSSRSSALWAATNELEPVAVCNHIPGGRNLIAAPERMTSFLELSIKHNKVFRGSMLFTLDELAPLTIIDPRGLPTRAPRSGGAAQARAERIALGRAAQPRGPAHQARRRAPRPGPRRRSSGRPPVRAGRRRGARARRPRARRAAGTDGPCSRSRPGPCSRRPVSPRPLARRAWFRAFSTQHCPIVKAIVGGGRRIPGDREAWFEASPRPTRCTGRVSSGARDGG